MSSGVNRLIVADLTKKKKSGKSLVKAIGSAFSPGKIARTKGKTQRCK